MRKRIFKWIKSWFVTQSLIASELVTEDAEKRINKISRRLSKHIKALRAQRKILDSINSSVVEDLEEADKALKQSEDALSAQRSELKILREVTLPTLTEQHKLILQRCEADIAVQVRRQVAVSPDREM